MIRDDETIDGDEIAEFDTIPQPAGPLERLRMYAVPLLFGTLVIGFLVLIVLRASGAIGSEPEEDEPEVFRAALAEREPPDLSRAEPAETIDAADYGEPRTTVVSEREPAEPAELAYPVEAPVYVEPPAPPARPMRGTKPMLVASSGSAGTPAPSGEVAPVGRTAEELFDGPASGGTARVAERIGRPDMTAPGGVTVPCVLDRSLMTATTGPASCTTIRDVLSVDLSRVLIPRGARVTGTHGSGTLGGADVVGVAWARVRHADVTVELGGDPAVGALGGVGIEASVERHFWQRFGGAIVVSLISDVGSAAVANAGRSGDVDVTVGATTSAANTVVEEIVQRTVDIPATGSVHQGQLVGVYLRDDLDFSAAYDGAAR